MPRKNKVWFEWWFRTFDENGDSLDLDPCDDLKDHTEFKQKLEPNEELELVRRFGNDDEGVLDAAYVMVSPDGKLPKTFG